MKESSLPLQGVHTLAPVGFQLKPPAYQSGSMKTGPYSHRRTVHSRLEISRNRAYPPIAHPTIIETRCHVYRKPFSSDFTKLKHKTAASFRFSSFQVIRGHTEFRRGVSLGVREHQGNGGRQPPHREPREKLASIPVQCAGSGTVRGSGPSSQSHQKVQTGRSTRRSA